MLAEARARELAQAVLEAAKKAGADEAEVAFGGGRSALTRFASNEIHQNVESASVDASLRVAIGKRTARTSTSRLDPEGLEALAKRTVEVAKLAPEDPGLLPVLSPEEAGSARGRATVDPATSEAAPEERAAIAKGVIDAVSGAGFTAAGYVSTAHDGTWAYANSRGLFRRFERTGAGFGLTVEGKDSSGWAEASSPRLSSIDAPALARRAIEKCRLSAAPTDVEPGEWDVVLEPAAVAELVDFLYWGGFSGQAYHEGAVWSAGQLGKKIVGENVTIRDDFEDERNPGAPFDGEGLARSRLVLVEKGVLAGLAWDRRSARKAGAAPTGHSYRVPNLWGGGPENAVFEGGKSTLDEMIASTKRGILVTRFWYNRLVEPKRLVVTGMTRDGTFLIEDGKLARGVKNMRFNQSVLDLLSRIELLGPTDPSTRVPSMKVKGFTFSSKTKF